MQSHRWHGKPSLHAYFDVQRYGNVYVRRQQIHIAFSFAACSTAGPLFNTRVTAGNGAPRRNAPEPTD
jgi:hypothetical protein